MLIASVCAFGSPAGWRRWFGFSIDAALPVRRVAMDSCRFRWLGSSSGRSFWLGRGFVSCSLPAFATIPRRRMPRGGRSATCDCAASAAAWAVSTRVGFVHGVRVAAVLVALRRRAVLSSLPLRAIAREMFPSRIGAELAVRWRRLPNRSRRGAVRPPRTSFVSKSPAAVTNRKPARQFSQHRAQVASESTNQVLAKGDGDERFAAASSQSTFGRPRPMSRPEPVERIRFAGRRAGNSSRRNEMAATAGDG